MNGFLLLPSEGSKSSLNLSAAPAAPAASAEGLGSLNPKRPPATTIAGLTQQLSSLAGRLSDGLGLGPRLSAAERRLLRLREERRQILELRMVNATTYDEWEAAALLLDELEDHTAWKNSTSDDGAFYNPGLISARLQDLQSALASSDLRRMLCLVRTALSRDVGGISNAELYNHTHTGTKRLVEQYVATSVELIEALVERSRNAKTLPGGLTHQAMLDQLVLARHSYGRSALVLSGGSVYGMAHIGVLKALFERRLLPRIISGTSAGSIVAAVVCTRKDDEISTMLQRFAHGDLAVFTDKDHPDSWLTHIGRALRFGAWHDSRHIARVMRELLGDITFQEAFNRTRRILNITVSSKSGLQLPPLLNYLSAPDVMVWSAVVASCSIPGIFDPRPLMVRDPATGDHVPWDPAEQLWLDGSLDNDVPVDRLGEMLNVNHFIVSQANPHIVLFVSKNDEQFKSTSQLQPKPSSSSSPSPLQQQQQQDDLTSDASATPLMRSLMQTLGWLGKSEALYCLEALVELGVFREGLGMLLQMLYQQYTADINILPRMSLAWGTYLIRNPTPEFMLEASRVGEHATWPSLSRIEQACAVELALDRAIHAMRERIAFSDSQVNLRRLFTGSAALGVLTPRVNGQATGKAPAPVTATSAAAIAAAATDAIADADADADAATDARYHHKRRGSGSSIQLLARRRRNRDELETIFSEDGGHDSEPELFSSAADVSDDASGGSVASGAGGGRGSGRQASGGSRTGGGSSADVVRVGARGWLATRRSMANMNLSSLLDRTPLRRFGSDTVPVTRDAVSASTAVMASPERRAHRGMAIRLNSLQQLPMSMSSKKSSTPTPPASYGRYDGFESGDISNDLLGPASTVAAADAAENGDGDGDGDGDGYGDGVDEDGSPLLQMKKALRHRRTLPHANNVSPPVSLLAGVAHGRTRGTHSRSRRSSASSALHMKLNIDSTSDDENEEASGRVGVFGDGDAEDDGENSSSDLSPYDQDGQRQVLQASETRAQLTQQVQPARLWSQQIGPRFVGRSRSNPSLATPTSLSALPSPSALTAARRRVVVTTPPRRSAPLAMWKSPDDEAGEEEAYDEEDDTSDSGARDCVRGPTTLDSSEDSLDRVARS